MLNTLSDNLIVRKITPTFLLALAKWIDMCPEKFGGTKQLRPRSRVVGLHSIDRRSKIEYLGSIILYVNFLLLSAENSSIQEVH